MGGAGSKNKPQSLLSFDTNQIRFGFSEHYPRLQPLSEFTTPNQNTQHPIFIQELLKQIFSHSSSVQILLSFGQVCQTFYLLSWEDTFWEPFLPQMCNPENIKSWNPLSLKEVAHSFSPVFSLHFPKQWKTTINKITFPELISLKPRITVWGAEGVGKTSMASQISTGVFPLHENLDKEKVNYQIEIPFQSKKINYDFLVCHSQRQVLKDILIRSSQAYIIVISVIDKESLWTASTLCQTIIETNNMV